MIKRLRPQRHLIAALFGIFGICACESAKTAKPIEAKKDETKSTTEVPSENTAPGFDAAITQAKAGQLLKCVIAHRKTSPGPLVIAKLFCDLEMKKAGHPSQAAVRQALWAGNEADAKKKALALSGDQARADKLVAKLKASILPATQAQLDLVKSDTLAWVPLFHHLHPEVPIGSIMDRRSVK